MKIKENHICWLITNAGKHKHRHGYGDLNSVDDGAVFKPHTGFVKYISRLPSGGQLLPKAIFLLLINKIFWDSS